jgi:hypothetical protein
MRSSSVSVTEAAMHAGVDDRVQGAATPVSGHPDAAVVGACHGFHVRSPLPLRLIGSADLRDPWPVLEISQATEPLEEPSQPPVYTWVPQPGKPFGGRLHRLSDGFGVWVDGLGAYRVDPASLRIAVPAGVAPGRLESRLWGIPAALCFMARGDLSLHGAAVDIGGAGLLLVGPGRFGKTTLAAAFLRAGHRVLAEDLCRCTVDPVPAVYPGPALLRLRKDSHERLGELRGTSVVTEDEDRVHLEIDPSLRGDVRPVPIRAIIALQAGSGPTSLERLDPLEAIRLLWATSFNLPDHADRARCFQGVSALTDGVRLWRLTRRLDYDGLEALVERLAARCLE